MHICRLVSELVYIFLFKCIHCDETFGLEPAAGLSLGGTAHAEPSLQFHFRERCSWSQSLVENGIRQGLADLFDYGKWFGELFRLHERNPVVYFIDCRQLK